MILPYSLQQLQHYSLTFVHSFIQVLTKHWVFENHSSKKCIYNLREYDVLKEKKKDVLFLTEILFFWSETSNK